MSIFIIYLPCDDKNFRAFDGTKKPMTEEERAELASHLDKDLDNFIDSLQKTPYKDGWKEETWREVTIILCYSLDCVLILTISCININDYCSVGNGETPIFHD